MARGAAIGIDNDFAPGQAAIRSGPTVDKRPRRINQQPGGGGQPACRNNRFNHLFHHRFTQRRQRKVGAMLRGDHDGVGMIDPSVAITQRHLALGIG